MRFSFLIKFATSKSGDHIPSLCMSLNPTRILFCYFISRPLILVPGTYIDDLFLLLLLATGSINSVWEMFQ